ncbi:MAG TPA: type IV secretion system DNA-binding domain-containing protein [Candidatus Paceibacterota bacterium]|nr:type IV secretion system DNA-binding domain-containing protein [Candidatus Paceibacterota bacterium]
MENPERVTYFAATDSRGKKVPFGIKAKDRERHMYVIGKTGMGKSTLLENMAIQDIRNGEGMAFIDPHGSAIDNLLDFIPENRIKDVVYFAPFDMEQPLAFNVMEDVGYDKRHLVVSGLMATFKKIWVDAWSARMEYILSNTLLALLEYPDATLLGVNRMYTDKAYRKKVVDNIKDPVVKDFWTKEFAGYTDKFTAEATPAIQNKIGQFTSNPLIRNIIGQPKSSFDIRTMMDERKILLVNLSKGLVGDVNMKLLGSMITTRLFLGAMSRADMPGHELKKAPKFYFYVDEFQNFANETFAEILSEARKYQLNLIIAHQYVEQMEEEVAAAVFGNVGTTIAFRVGPFDAEKLEVVFAPEFTPEDLVNLGFTQIYLTLMIDGIGSRPFSAVTIPPIEQPSRSFRAEVVEASRTQFGNPRTSVEEVIYGELAATANEAAAADELAKSQREARRYAERPRETRPQSRREERPPAPRPHDRSREERRSEPRPAPAARAHTAEDLKSILKSTLQKSEKQEEKHVARKQESLRSTLANVIEKEKPREGKGGQEPRHLVREAPPAKKQEAEENGMPVFEVPEKVLKDLFKDNF